MIPCKECIALAACRHKTYTDMVIQCTKLRDILYNGQDVKVPNREEKFASLIKEVDSVICSTVWMAQFFRGSKYHERQVNYEDHIDIEIMPRITKRYEENK